METKKRLHIRNNNLLGELVEEFQQTLKNIGIKMSEDQIQTIKQNSFLANRLNGYNWKQMLLNFQDIRVLITVKYESVLAENGEKELQSFFNNLAPHYFMDNCIQLLSIQNGNTIKCNISFFEWIKPSPEWNSLPGFEQNPSEFILESIIENDKSPERNFSDDIVSVCNV